MANWKTASVNKNLPLPPSRSTPHDQARKASSGISSQAYCSFLTAMVLLNSLLLMLYNLTAIDALDILSNGVAGLTICFSTWTLVSNFVANNVFKLLAILLVGLFGNILFNFGRTDYLDLLKFIELFVIFGAAYGTKGRVAVPKWIYILPVLPLALVALGGSRIDTQAAGIAWSYFPNKNTAVLFYSCFIFACSLTQKKYLLPIQIAISISFRKIGILLSTLAAMIFSGVIKVRISAVVYMFGFFAIGTAAYLLGALDRAIAVVGGFISDMRLMGVSGIANSSFSDLYRSRGEDLSAYFRIIHWHDIVGMYFSGGWSVWLFGYGANQTKITSRLQLVPHNDYLKVIAELGLINFIAFIYLIFTCVRGVRDKTQRALILVVVFYFFTDNLITNFSSMALLFGFCGFMSSPDSRASLRSPSKSTRRM